MFQRTQMLATKVPAGTAEELSPELLQDIEFVLDAPVGTLKNRSVVMNARSGKIIRQ